MKEQLIRSFTERFGTPPTVVSRAPGRLEILGNHTDYNGGVVLSAAIDRYTWLAAAPSTDEVCTLFDFDLKQERRFTRKLLNEPLPKCDWANYVKGMFKELTKHGVNPPPFNALITGDIPLSAGMSSSASFEMAAGLALCKLADKTLDWKTMAKTGQACENNWIGAQTGLLDQFSSLCGKKDCLVFSDFKSLDTRTIPIPGGTAFVVINSMVRHNLVNEYNERRASCEDAVICLRRRTPSIHSLRDVPLKLLCETKKRIRSSTFDCAAHVIGENIRVFEGIKALENDDLETFGELMFQSQESSRLFFKNSCPEIDLIIEIAKKTPGCIGARLSGGGFGGITVHLVKAAVAKDYLDAVTDEYKRQTGVTPQALLCKASNGATLI